MHLSSVNVAPKPSASKAVEGNAPALPETSSAPDDFANALKGQEKLLKETSGETKPAVQQQSSGSEPNATELEIKTDGQKELVAMLEKYLAPVTIEKGSEAVAPDEPTLLALTEETITPAPITPPILEAALPSNPVADVATTQDVGNAMALTGLNFAKPMPEAAQPNVPFDNSAPEISLQKQIVSGQPNQASQTNQPVSLEATDNAETFKQALTSAAGPETATPEIKTEPLPMTARPIDTRMETVAISKPLAHPGWSKDLGEHILWMNTKEISAAEIKLNPAHLGPISVRIDVNQDNQTSILFTALHAETKEALEASIPKLKEMLLGQQLNLVNVNISQNSSSNNGRQTPQPFYGSHDQNLENLPAPLDTSDSGQILSKGLLSLYA